MLRSYLAMISRLKAEEALDRAAVHAMAAGTMRERDAREMQRRLTRQIGPVPRAAASFDAVAAMGIAVQEVPGHG